MLLKEIGLNPYLLKFLLSLTSVMKRISVLLYDSDEGDKKPAAKRQKTDALLEGISASAIALLKGEKAWGEGAVSNALN